MDEPLRLLSVHAHPDDESSKGAATVYRYSGEGVRCVLVCCTGGEEGDIHNPAMDRPEVRADLHRIRLGELDAAAGIIGYHEVVLLGYRDSGMAGTDANAHLDCFAQADLAEAVGRLVEVVRRERPQVMITYADDQQGYHHPDHIRAHEIGLAAFEASGDGSAYPGAGEPWAPAKLYYSAWSRVRIEVQHERFLALGLESPFDDVWRTRPSLDHRLTTKIAVPGGERIRRAALRAHATQIDPESRRWFGLPEDDDPYPWEDYILARSSVASKVPEDDLFAGLRGPPGTSPSRSRL